MKMMWALVNKNKNTYEYISENKYHPLSYASNVMGRHQTKVERIIVMTVREYNKLKKIKGSI